MRNKRSLILYIASFLSFKSRIFKPLLLLFFLLLFTGSFYGQDLRFSQFHASSAYTNPAFVGTVERPRVILNFRDQWPDMPQTYLSYRFAFDEFLAPIHSGIGVYAFQDNEGDNIVKTTSLGLQYMYQAKFTEKLALNSAVQVSYNQKNLDWNRLQFYDQIDPLYGFNDASGIPNATTEPLPPQLSDNFLDLGAGALLYSDKYFVGISAFHLTQPTESFYNNSGSRLPLNVTGQIGAKWSLGNKHDPFVISPVVVYTTQTSFQQLLAGCYFKKNIVLTGLFLKHNFESMSDVTLLIGLAKGSVAFAYNYDVSLGRLAGNSGGSHEVSLIYTFREGYGKMTSRRQKSSLECPSVFY